MPGPPRRLPSGFHPIWRALKRADDGSPSRQSLATRLGVSTATLQRILVRGDVPDFAAGASVRETRSWTRTLARIAVRLERDPGRWVRGAGISWDEGTRMIAEEAAARARSEPRTRRRAGRDVLDVLRARVDRGRTDPVDVGILDVRPFSDPLRDHPGSFFSAIARRVVGGIEPEWGIRIRPETAASLARSLGDPRDGIQIAIGLFETPHLESRGFSFLRLPGWEIRFSALWVRGRGIQEEALPGWDQMVSGGPPVNFRFLVTEGDPAHGHLRGQYGIRSERILVRRPSTPERLGDDIAEECRRHPLTPVVLVADEETCRRVRGHLARSEGFARNFVAKDVPADPGVYPRYSLGVAVREDSGRWRDLVESSWWREVFGASSAPTARLYADLLLTGAYSFPWALRRERRSTLRLRAFETSPGFRGVLCRSLLSGLAEDPRLRVFADEKTSDFKANPDSLREIVARVAEAVLPGEWKPDVEEALEAIAWKSLLEFGERAGGRFPVPRWYCESCSTSLLEHPGPSERYCRFCSDDQGRLRSREEVHEILAHWIAGWQEGVSLEEARTRASRFMETMPAWSRN